MVRQVANIVERVVVNDSHIVVIDELPLINLDSSSSILRGKHSL